MSGLWATLIAVAAISAALKAAGPALLGERQLPLRARAFVALLAPALLAALVVVQTFGSGRQLTTDARAVGVVTAAVALTLRFPSPLAVVAAAAVTALVRALS
jgi:hypothetical protein